MKPNRWFLIILSGFVFMMLSASMCLTQEWQKTVNGRGEGNDGAEAVALDEDGNIFVAGYVDVGDDTDVWVRKYNSNGRIIWTKTHDGSGRGDDAARGVAVNSDGESYVAGFVTDTDSRAHVWVRKYDTDGSIIWTRSFRGPGDGGKANDVALDSEGNVYVIASVDVPLEASNIWVQKYSPDGGELWSRTFTTSAASKINPLFGNDDQGFAITVSPDDYIYATGYEDHTAEDTWESIWVAKFDTEGEVLWTRTYDSSDHDHDHGFGIVADEESVYVVGRTVLYEPGVGIRGNLIIQKYSAEGRKLWQDVFDSESALEETARSVALGPDGNVYIIGSREHTYPNMNVWIRVYSPRGNLLSWMEHETSGGTRNFGEDVAVSENGRVYVVGSEEKEGEGFNIWVAEYSVDSEK